MKRFTSLIFLLSIFIYTYAQKNRFIPLETWPYVYENFTPGTVLTHKGVTNSFDLLNINIADGKLHYVENGVIMQADMNLVSLIRIGQDVYVNYGGYAYKALAQTDHGAVLLKTEVDMEQLSKANIGYGKSSVASTSNVSAYALPGGNNINKSLEDINNNRYSGNELPIREKYYLYIDGKLVRASKKDVLVFAGDKQNNTKEYIKNNKIKWKDVFCLQNLVEYLYGISANNNE